MASKNTTAGLLTPVLCRVCQVRWPRTLHNESDTTCRWSDDAAQGPAKGPWLTHLVPALAQILSSSHSLQHHDASFMQLLSNLCTTFASSSLAQKASLAHSVMAGSQPRALINTIAPFMKTDASAGKHGPSFSIHSFADTWFCFISCLICCAG